MVHFLSRRLNRPADSGAVAVLTAILLSSVFLGLSALVIDLGMDRDTRRQSQNAADASVLAAGNVLYPAGSSADFTTAIAAAEFYAAKNYDVTSSDWASCTDSAALTYHPDTTCISFDSSTAPASVRVTIPVRQVATFFAGIWGVKQVPVNASAQVQLTPGGLAQCGLCIVGSGTHNLQNGSITVLGAGVAVNGTLDANPQGSITVSPGNTITLQGPVPGKGTYTPAPQAFQAAVADPLASLPMPDYSSLTAQDNSCTRGPGIYSSLTAGCTMTPGLYVLTGSTSLSGNSFINAPGVTLYFICGTPTLPRSCNFGESGGSISMRGNAYLTITAPTSGPTQGLSMVSDRNNTSTLSFGGNGSATSSGTIYALNGTLAYNGNGAVTGLNSLVVAGDFSFAGNPSAFMSKYTQSANVSLPSSNLHLSQ